MAVDFGRITVALVGMCAWIADRRLTKHVRAGRNVERTWKDHIASYRIDVAVLAIEVLGSCAKVTPKRFLCAVNKCISSHRIAF